MGVRIDAQIGEPGVHFAAMETWSKWSMAVRVSAAKAVRDFRREM